MPLTIRSFRDTWQQDRPTFTPRKTTTYTRATASVAANEAPRVKTGGWASLLASAHDAYMRDRQMTTDERVEMELRKLAQRNKANEREIMSGTTAISPQQQIPDPLTVDALTALDRQDTYLKETEENDGSIPEMVPSMNYAVAELAKSLEETRKAFKKAMRENEELRRENNELKEDRRLKRDLEAQIRKLDKYVSPEAHAKLRTGWEEWADVAEKKIESLQTRVGDATDENDTLLAKIQQREGVISKLEARVKSFQDWTSPHERKVLDATIDMLHNEVDEMKMETENCPSCVQRQVRASRTPLMDITKPVLGRGRMVA